MNDTGSAPIPDTAATNDAAATLRAGAALWRHERTLPDDIAAYAQELASGPWFRIAITAHPHDLPASLAGAFALEAIPDRPERRRLARDIAMLARLLVSVVGCEAVAVRLEHDAGATCPVFHQDQNVLRLLCTYAGAGTEWLPEAHLDRTELGLQGRTPEAANQAIARGTPEHARTGEVLLLKGARYDRDHSSLVHKSPPADLGPRLLLAIDAADAAAAAERTHRHHDRPGQHRHQHTETGAHSRPTTASWQ